MRGYIFCYLMASLAPKYKHSDKSCIFNDKESHKKCGANTARRKNKSLYGWRMVGTHYTRVTQVLKCSQTYLPGEKNASIFLNVEDAGIHRSTVLCRHSMFDIKVVFFCLYYTQSDTCHNFVKKKKKREEKTNKTYKHVLLSNYNATHVWKNLGTETV